jgi:hypothetical protein
MRAAARLPKIPAYGRVEAAERIGFDTCTEGPARETSIE